ncbi:glycosyltransferase family 9 protein [Planctomycetota bacterium]
MGTSNDKDILTLWENEQTRAVQRNLRALIIQPGALGDGILTLPLVRLLKEILSIGGVDILGHAETLGVFPQRTCVDSIRSIETVDLQRLFIDPKDFTLADRDPLIYAFSEYTWIISFLGEPDSHFEQNLLYTVHCSHSAEIITLPLKPPTDYPQHVTRFYQEHFLQSLFLPPSPGAPTLVDTPIQATEDDRQLGQRLLQQRGVNCDRPLTVLHPGSGGQAKCWHLDNFLALASQLSNRDHEVAFLIGPVEQERWPAETLQKLRAAAPFLDDLTLEQTLAVLAHAQSVVANDSGISHLAAGLGTQTVVLFGPTTPSLYRPVGPQVSIVHDPSPIFNQGPSEVVQAKVRTLLSNTAD